MSWFTESYDVVVILAFSLVEFLIWIGEYKKNSSPSV